MFYRLSSILYCFLFALLFFVQLLLSTGWRLFKLKVSACLLDVNTATWRSTAKLNYIS